MRGALFWSLTALLLAGNLAAAQNSPPMAAAPPTAPEGLSTPGAPPGNLMTPPAMPVEAMGEDGIVPDYGLVPGGAWPLPGPYGRFYVSADYLLWWTKGQALPPLVTSGSLDDDVPGAVDQPGSSTLIGNQNADNQVRSGAMFTAGFWLNEAQTAGLEGGIFFLAPRSSQSIAGSDGSTLLARPYFAVGTVTASDGTQTDLAEEQALLIASPGMTAGNVVVRTANRFWGAEANGRFNVSGDTFYRFDLLAGFRYLELKEQLGVISMSDTIPSSGPIIISDTFNTTNRFYGGQIGAVANFWRGRWFTDIRGTLALGGITRSATINGATTFTAPDGTTTVVPGGLLAQPTNIGHYSNTVFGVVPAVAFRLGYQITDRLRVYAGYSLIYIGRGVAQPGDQIDRAVNVNQIPALGVAPLAGDSRPAFAFHGTDFWAQGFLVGFTLNF